MTARKDQLSKSDSGAKKLSTKHIHRCLSSQDFSSLPTKQASDTTSTEPRFSDSFTVDSQKEASYRAVREWHKLTLSTPVPRPSKRTSTTKSKFSLPESMPVIEGTLFHSELFKSGEITKSDTRQTKTVKNLLRRTQSESALLVDDEGKKTPRKWGQHFC